MRKKTGNGKNKFAKRKNDIKIEKKNRINKRKEQNVKSETEIMLRR